MRYSKRDKLALFSDRMGLTRLLLLLPSNPVLLALNHHRIGKADDCPYDSELFSATAEQLDEQIRFLKQHFQLVGLDEAIELIEARKRPTRPAVLITFDDGYVDNYLDAYPVLASHGVQGIFFLPTSYIGTNRLPWWDVIAFIVKGSRKDVVRLHHPSPREFNLKGDGANKVVEQVLWIYKLDAIGDPAKFIAMLEDAFDSPRPQNSVRAFVTWDEAREMVRGGMAVGAHSHSHEILSRLPEEQQVEEVQISKQLLEQQLGVPILSMSYPVGLRDSFSPATRAAVEQANYRVAFSFYGAVNRVGHIDRYDVGRVIPSAWPAARFRFQTSLARGTGRYWF